MTNGIIWNEIFNRKRKTQTISLASSYSQPVTKKPDCLSVPVPVMARKGAVCCLFCFPNNLPLGVLRDYSFLPLSRCLWVDSCSKALAVCFSISKSEGCVLFCHTNEIWIPDLVLQQLVQHIWNPVFSHEQEKRHPRPVPVTIKWRSRHRDPSRCSAYGNGSSLPPTCIEDHCCSLCNCLWTGLPTSEHVSTCTCIHAHTHILTYTHRGIVGTISQTYRAWWKLRALDFEDKALAKAPSETGPDFLWCLKGQLMWVVENTAITQVYYDSRPEKSSQHSSIGSHWIHLILIAILWGRNSSSTDEEAQEHIACSERPPDSETQLRFKSSSVPNLANS